MRFDLNSKHRVVTPSQVFQAEPSNPAGYARTTITLTLTADQVARVGSVIEYDPVALTGTLNATGAPVVPENKLGIFFGRDVLVDPTHFERLVASHDLDGATVKVTLITRGDGSGAISPTYLDFAGTDFWSLSGTAQAEFRAYVEQTLRMKFIKQQKLPV